MAEPKQGEWHRVMLNTIVRKGVALDSERLRILPMGSRVFVISQLERRVEISEPIHGWCSMKSSNGDTILTPVQDAKGVPATPSSANTNVAAKFSSFNARAEAAQLNVEKEDANINKWSSNLSEDSRKRVYELAKISEKKALEEKLLSLKSELLSADPTPENNETVRHLTEALRNKSAAVNKKNMFEQMKEAANTEIETIKKQYSDYFGIEMSHKEKQLYPRDVVRIQGEYGLGLAIVRFFDVVEGEHIVGLELSEPDGRSDGIFKGERYYQTEPNCAVFMEYPNENILGRIEAGDLLKKLNSIVVKINQLQTGKE